MTTTTTRVIRSEAKVTKCFSCEKDLVTDKYDTIHDAGYAELGFHYGSELDQCHGFSGRKDRPDPDSLENMLMSDIIELYICDDCFRKKHHLCNGYDDVRINYGKLKEEQAQILKEWAAWYNSPAGRAEWDENMTRLRQKDAESRASLKRKVDGLFVDLTSARNKGKATAELESEFNEYKRQYQEMLSWSKKDEEEGA